MKKEHWGLVMIAVGAGLLIGVAIYLATRGSGTTSHHTATCWAHPGYFVDHGHGRVIFWSGTGSPPSHVFRRHGPGNTPNICGPPPS